MNLIQILDIAVKSFPNETAIKGNGFKFTYSEFDASTHNFAKQLINAGVKPNDVIGLCLDRSAEMLIGIFGILKAGAAYLPVDGSHPPKRIQSILNDADVKWVVTTSDLSDFVNELGFIAIVPDCRPTKQKATVVLPNISDTTTAYILFTSGSTGTPKGVLIPHVAVSNLVEYMQSTYPLSKADVVMLKSPYTFDGSIWELFGWMLMGGTLFITPKGAEKDPAILCEIIINERISFLFFVPSMLQAFVGYCRLQNTVFESLKWVSVGGEVLPVTLVDTFYTIFDYKNTKLINVYGPTETTVYATTYCCKPISSEQKISIGFEVTNDYLYILDQNQKPVTEGEEGEIYIGGVGVGKGYLNRPDLTAEKFVDDPFTGNGKMYRTGDIGRKNDDGSFDFVGRVDFQVKLRGLRIEIGEIEHALLQLEGVAECVVLMSKDRSGNDSLRAFLRMQTFDTTISTDFYLVSKTQKEHLWNQLKQWLPDYMLPADFIIFKKFPLTTHEKIDRAELLKTTVDNTDEPSISNQNLTDTETKLKALWERILGQKTIGLTDDFMEAGGHSLKVVQLITSVMSEFGIEIPMTDFYDGISIYAMSQGIDNNQYSAVNKIVASTKIDAKQTIFPLTPEQSEMWIVNSLDSTGLTHNIQIEFVLKGNPDIERFKKSVVEVIKHEEMFRSFFELKNELPVQHLMPDVTCDIREINLSLLPEKEKNSTYENILKSNGKIVFELERLPLFSFVLVRWSTDEYRLLMASHHLIFDGWSLHLLMERIANYYKNETLTQIQYRNADFANYLKQSEIQAKAKRELDYWKKELLNIPTELSLPKKRNFNPSQVGKKGKRYWWMIDAELTRKIEALALKFRTTPYTIFMSAYQLALGAASNQSDIVVGSPLANRNNELINNLIGYYTNMVCIRGSWFETDSIQQFIEKCNSRIIGAFANSTISYGEVAKELNKTIGIASNAVFHAIFVLQNWPHIDYNLPEFTFSQREIGNDTSKTNFLLNVEKTDKSYCCWLEYDTELFELSVTKQLAEAITSCLKYITEQPSATIKALNDTLISHFDFSDSPTCYVVGEGKLAAHCIEILTKNGFKIQKVISIDDWLLADYANTSYHGDALNSGKTELQPVDYIFSINNSIVLKKDFIALAKKLAINYHDALLPCYAGMYASNWALLNNEKKHGISWHVIAEKVDAGAILQTEQFEISENETAFTLNTKCFEAAIVAFEKLVEALVTETVQTIPQDLKLRTYFGLGTRPANFGCIFPNQHATDIDRLLRATDFGPHHANEFLLPLLFVKNQFYTLAKATVLKNIKGQAGEIANVDDKRGFYCTDGFVVLELVFAPNGKRVPTEELLLTGDLIESPYSDLLVQAAAYFSKIAKHEVFWKKQLLSTEYCSWPFLAGNNKQTEAQLSLDANTRTLLQTLAPESEICEIVKALFALYLVRLSYTETTTFGLLTQMDTTEKQLADAGLFSAIVPLNIKLQPNETLLQALQSVLTALKKAQTAQTFTQNIFQRYPELADKSNEQASLVFVNETLIAQPDERLQIQVNQDFIKLFTHHGAKFSGITQALENFGYYLENALHQPETLCSTLPLAMPETLLVAIDKLHTPVSEALGIENIIAIFWEIAKKHPDNIAIYDAGKQYSYAEFSEDILTLAARLKKTGINSNTVVAVAIEQTYHYFVSIMAILHHGAAFLTIDTKLPIDRKKYIIENAQAQLILVSERENNFDNDLKILDVAKELLDNQDFEIDYLVLEPDNTAYIIYTSGSSGLPKGVKISNSNLSNFVSGAIALYQIEQHDKILQFSTLSFDASIEEIFCSFCSGASLYLRTDEMLDTSELSHFVDIQQITLLDLPTSYWRQLIHTNALKSINSKSLRLIIIGGEALTPADVDHWKTTNPSYQLVNTYGPTETTVVALAQYIDASQAEFKAIPIGRPLYGYKPYIVDKQHNIVPPGVVGELLIAGNSVSPGYVNERNNKAFVWLKNPNNELIRCYCTGDKVYADEHGIVYFIGRTDEQLKIRGYRVEPAEIEAQLNKMEGVETSIVLAQKSKNGDLKLIAFYKLKSKNGDIQAIKEQLKSHLPAYMIPESFIAISFIPLTANGKIDKRKLLVMSDEQQSLELSAIDKPTTEAEEYLLGLWQKILGISHIGIHDDFFEIGGHSLKAVALMAQIQKEKGLKLPLASLIQHSTIHKFAKLLTAESKTNAWNCLVPIRTEGSKTPIFLIHGAGLNILLYKSLSTYLDPDRPIYAFQASGLDGSKPIKNSIPEMAAEYIDEMLRIQPTGSYILLGFSLGGFIAYEMAMQLRILGKSLKFTGLIDSVSFLAHYYNSNFEKFKVDAICFLYRPFYLFWLFLKTPNDEKRRFIKLKNKNFKLSMLYYFTKLGLIKQQHIGEELEQLSFLSDNVLIAMNQSLKKYKLNTADFHIDLFKAGKATFFIYEREYYGWKKFAKRGITTHTIPSEHSKLFAAPYDRLFAEIIENRLAKLEADEVAKN